jgi:hypothetical protein
MSFHSEFNLIIRLRTYVSDVTLYYELITSSTENTTKSRDLIEQQSKDTLRAQKDCKCMSILQSVLLMRKWFRIVGIAIGYGLDDGDRSSSSGRVKNFLFSMSSTPALGFTQPPIQWGTGVSFPGVKRPGREADHSLPSSAQVKKLWTYTSTPPYACMA